MKRVSEGSLALPRSLYILAKIGMRNSTMPMSTMMAKRADHDRVDHRRLDGAADAVVLLELRGEAVEHLVQDTAELAGAHHAHVEPAEDLGMLLQRVATG